MTEASKRTVITTWMQRCVDEYTKKDKRNMQGVLNRFADFLKQKEKSRFNFWQP